MSKIDELRETRLPTVGDRVRLQAHDGRKVWWEGMTGVVVACLPPVVAVDPKQRPQVELWRVRLDQAVVYHGATGQQRLYAEPTPCVEWRDIWREPS